MSSEITEWDTYSLLSPSGSESTKMALVLLNQRLPNFKLFHTLWKKASLKICADGGANRLYDLSQDIEEYRPDIIVGDFDSIRPSVKEFYERKGVPTIHESDQYSTDLDKSLRVLLQQPSIEHDTQIVIVGGISSRLDQTISTVHMLENLRIPQKVWVIAEQSMVILLRAGKHLVKPTSEFFTPNSGILPLFGQANVITTGFEWNLGPCDYVYPTAMTRPELSTSNHVVDPAKGATLETDISIAFSVEVLETNE